MPVKTVPGCCWRLLSTCVLFATLICSAHGGTNRSVGGNLHWAYASYFGTGVYQVRDNKSVTVLRPTARWNFTEAGFDDEGSRELGWKLRVPVAAGFHRLEFDDLPEFIDPDNFGSISITPGVDLDIPVTRRWTLRPSANLGWGTLADGSESAWTYWVGIHSRFAFSTGKLNWALLNSLSHVGYSPDDDRNESMVPLMTGLEFDYPLPWKLAQQPLELNWHVTYTSFYNDLNYVIQRRELAKAVDQWQAGVALGRQGGKFELWNFKVDRIGLALTRAGNDFGGVKVYFRSVFDW